MATKTKKDYEEDYTNPRLREELKEEIKEGSKGGKKGQWSARKSQLLTKEYEAHGGDYKHKDHLSSSQENLKKWTAQEWQTQDHTKAQKDNKTSRYLPKKVWEHLSDQEKKETTQEKESHSKEGAQYVKNPSSVTKKISHSE